MPYLVSRVFFTPAERILGLDCREVLLRLKVRKEPHATFELFLPCDFSLEDEVCVQFDGVEFRLHHKEQYGNVMYSQHGDVWLEFERKRNRTKILRWSIRLDDKDVDD